MTIKDLLLLLKPGSGCDYHRLVLPLGYAGYDFNNGVGLTTEKLRGFKAIVFNRVPLNVKPETLKDLRAQYGHKIWIDIDDYWVLPEFHYLKRGWAKSDVTGRIMQFIKMADIVTCTTDRLASKIKDLNDKVSVIPNSLPFIEHSQFTFTRQPADYVRFGFVGGASHLRDVRQLIPVFQQYSQLPFKFCGYSERNGEAVKMADVFSNNGRNKNYTQVNMQPLDHYLYGYDDIDVCIAPLEDIEFNKYKSNLKVLEAGLKKCAIVCSPNACYTDTVPDNIATYAKSIKDWKEAFKKHMDKDYVKEQGEKVYEWVKQNYNLPEVNEARLKLIENL